MLPFLPFPCSSTCVSPASPGTPGPLSRPRCSFAILFNIFEHIGRQGLGCVSADCPAHLGSGCAVSLGGLGTP